MKQPAKAFGLAALALCAVWSTACQSNQPKQAKHDSTQKQIFHEVDANADDQLDPEEFHSYFYMVSFWHHDEDGDDRLTIIEWAGDERTGEHETLFAEMDEDGNGWLHLEEYSSHSLRTVTVTNAFFTLDRNGDRVVMLDELTAD